MHKTRVLTALIVGPVLAGLLWWGGPTTFSLLALSVTALCIFEYFSFMFKEQGLLALLGVLLGNMPVLSMLTSNEPALLSAETYLILLVSAFFFILTYSRWSAPFLSWAMFFMGVFYISSCMAHLVLLRQMEMGREWLFFLLAVIYAGDTGAYYVGHALGRHKLCPSVSKGKTIEGAVGGLAASTAAGVAVGVYLLPAWPVWFLALIAGSTGAVGQLGDLAESVMKRFAEVKDSGTLLPGHGGIFDRIDALLLAAPALFWLIHLTKGVITP
jgi:phosphatidate cytidylyltransferase